MYEFFIHFGWEPLTKCMICKYFLPFCRLPLWECGCSVHHRMLSSIPGIQLLDASSNLCSPHQLWTLSTTSKHVCMWHSCSLKSWGNSTIWQILFSKGACYIYTTDVTLFFSTTHRHSKKRGISIFLSSVKNKTIQTTMSNQILPYSTIFISSSQNHHHIDLWYGEHCQTESINISGEFLFLQANHIQLLETHELKAMGLVLFFKPHGHIHPLQIRAL